MAATMMLCSVNITMRNKVNNILLHQMSMTSTMSLMEVTPDPGLEAFMMDIMEAIMMVSTAYIILLQVP